MNDLIMVSGNHQCHLHLHLHLHHCVHNCLLAICLFAQAALHCAAVPLVGPHLVH